MKKLPGESRNGFPAFDEAQKDTQVLLPPLSLSLCPCVSRAFFSRDAFLAKSQEINEGIFQSFQRIGARGGRASLQEGKRNSLVEGGGVGKKRFERFATLFAIHPSSFFSSLIHLSFFRSLS